MSGCCGIDEPHEHGEDGEVKVKEGIDRLLARTRADELMIVSDMYDVDKRIRSFEIISEVVNG